MQYIIYLIANLREKSNNCTYRYLNIILNFITVHHFDQLSP